MFTNKSIERENHPELEIRTINPIRFPKIVKKSRRIIYEEMSGFHLKLWLANLFLSPIPWYAGSRLRVKVLRLAGFQLGRGTVMSSTPVLVGTGNLYQRLVVGEDCYFNVGCFLDLSALISIGDRVSLGHQVILLTNTHNLGDAHRRAGPLVAKPIHIGNGVWLGAKSTVLPGITVGEGAIVAAGAMVTRDVPPHTMVAGVPAEPLRELPVGQAKGQHPGRSPGGK